MPCFFAGPFYVTDIIDRSLNCIFMNEHLIPVAVSMTYFHNRSIADSAPSAVAYQRPQPGHVYLVFGTLAFAANDFRTPIVSFLPLLNLYVLSDIDRCKLIHYLRSQHIRHPTQLLGCPNLQLIYFLLRI